MKRGKEESENEKRKKNRRKKWKKRRKKNRKRIKSWWVFEEVVMAGDAVTKHLAFPCGQAGLGSASWTGVVEG